MFTMVLQYYYVTVITLMSAKLRKALGDSLLHCLMRKRESRCTLAEEDTQLHPLSTVTGGRSTKSIKPGLMVLVAISPVLLAARAPLHWHCNHISKNDYPFPLASDHRAN